MANKNIYVLYFKVEIDYEKTTIFLAASNDPVKLYRIDEV